ncbi:hypothetical protein [Pseudomonas kitaguniensis]|uniref:hypothetical protein n=1 Tax=Pseudomonas kitaguniensis TaxID=2607908 RepID=UPI003BA3D1C6
MKAIAATILIITLAGCANHPLDCATGLVAWDDCLPGTKGYAIRQESMANLAATKAQQASSDDAQCQSYGAKPGSDAYVNCRVQLNRTTTEQQSQQSAQRQQAIQTMLLNQQNQQQKPYVLQQPPQIIPARVQTNCTTHTSGQIVYTNCQ